MMPLKNAKDTPLSKQSAGLPSVDEALPGLLQPLTFVHLQRQKNDGVVVYVPNNVNAMACRQPLSAQAISIKPEGQRAWRWEKLFADRSVVLVVGDGVVLDGVQYRVMARADWGEYGYFYYEIAESFQEIQQS